MSSARPAICSAADPQASLSKRVLLANLLGHLIRPTSLLSSIPCNPQSTPAALLNRTKGIPSSLKHTVLRELVDDIRPASCQADWRPLSLPPYVCIFVLTCDSFSSNILDFQTSASKRPTPIFWHVRRRSPSQLPRSALPAWVDVPRDDLSAQPIALFVRCH